MSHGPFGLDGTPGAPPACAVINVAAHKMSAGANILTGSIFFFTLLLSRSRFFSRSRISRRSEMQGKTILVRHFVDKERE
jgi:hypothetical protein